MAKKQVVVKKPVSKAEAARLTERKRVDDFMAKGKAQRRATKQPQKTKAQPAPRLSFSKSISVISRGYRNLQGTLTGKKTKPKDFK